MKIDSDLMDGGRFRQTSDKEDKFIDVFMNESDEDQPEMSDLFLVDGYCEESFMLGRQYERNRLKDDGK